MLQLSNIEPELFKNNKKILLRTTTLLHIKEIINIFINKNINFDILTQEELHFKEAEQEKKFETKGFFKIWKCSLAWLMDLYNQKYEIVLIPYNNKTRNGYFNIELFAFLITRKKVIGITHTNEFFEITFLKFLFSYAVTGIIKLEKLKI